MPIQVIVVLFIAIVVGGAIIAFSRSTLDSAQLQLSEQWRSDPQNKDLVVDIPAATPEAILHLANQCVEQSLGVVLEKKLCFAIFSQSFPQWSALDGRALQDDFELETSAISGSPSAVRLIFDPNGVVEVTD